eukprot:scaffold45827_cov20-Tisochrysis_lutea.AAC.2
MQIHYKLPAAVFQDNVSPMPMLAPSHTKHNCNEDSIGNNSTCHQAMCMRPCSGSTVGQNLTCNYCARHSRIPTGGLPLGHQVT